MKRVRDGEELHPRSDEDLFTDANGSGVEENAVQVDERVLVNRNVHSVVAEEGRLDPDTSPDVAEELDEHALATSSIAIRRCRECLKKNACTLGEREQFGIA